MHCRLAFTTFITLAWPLAAGGSEINITEWRLRTSVDSSGFGSDLDLFQTVQMPFQSQHGVSLTHAAASASYDFMRDDTGFARFLIRPSQSVSGGNAGSVQAVSEGRINVIPAQDTLVKFSGSMDYNLSGGDRLASIFVRVWDEEAQVPLITFSQGVIYFNDPLTGTMTIPDTHYQLNANHEYLLYYSTLMRAGSGSSDTIAGFNRGEVMIELTPLPEPATATLLCIVLTALCKRRRGRTVV